MISLQLLTPYISCPVRLIMMIPILTQTSAARFFTDTTCSPRKTADSATPNTGILNPNIATFPTELYFKSSAHIQNAAVDNSDI